MWGLWLTKRQWGRFPTSTSVSPANHYSTSFTIIIITRSWHNRPIGGRGDEWTQLDSIPPIIRIKKIWLSKLFMKSHISPHVEESCVLTIKLFIIRLWLTVWSLVRVKVTLRLAVYSQSVRLGKPPWDSRTVIFFFKWTLAVIVLFDERMCLWFTFVAGPRQRSHFQVRVPRNSCPHSEA
jgi:hypothetical protein